MALTDHSVAACFGAAIPTARGEAALQASRVVRSLGGLAQEQ